MGNVNGNPSEEEEEQGCATVPLMSQSPPTSPTATHSPFIFTPQVPVIPLQRPYEMRVPNHSCMQTTLGYEDMYSELGVPTMITWSYDGKEVAVEGSWDNWKTRMPLQRSGKDFTIMKVLPSGVYQYRFIVDGRWRYTPDLPWAKDDAESENAYNILDLQFPKDSVKYLRLMHAGASVAVNCQSHASKGKGKPMVAQGVTDEFGDFMVDLPSYLHAIPNLEKICTVKVHRIPEGSLCRPARVKKYKGLELSSFGNGIRTYNAGNIRIQHSTSESLHAPSIHGGKE